MEEKIEVGVKLMDNSTYTIQIFPTDTIKNLKDEIEKILAIPTDKQRLIYSGRYLREEQTIRDAKIEHKHIIHLIARPIPNEQSQNQEEETQSTTQASNVQTGQDQDEGSVLSEIEFLQDIFRQLNHLQIVQQNQRKIQLQQRTQGYIYLQREKMKESIQQNYDSIDILMNTTTNNSDQKQKYVESFDNSKRIFKIGQWVDVKDTINQWLEAQVIKVNEAEQKLFIHYNGWGTRWDEWIDMKSERIALFRTHTVQSQGSMTMSPFPNDDIDGDKSEIPERPNFDELLYKTCGLFNSVNAKLLELVRQNNTIKYSNDRSEVELATKQRAVLSSQLAPIFDRSGRMIMDIGMMLGDIGSETQKIQAEDDEDEEEKSQADDQNDQQSNQNMDILSNRSNSSLGRYSNNQSEGTYFHNEREDAQNSNISRSRQRNLYRFTQPVMLNPGELHKINRLGSDRVHIQRIILPSQLSFSGTQNQNNNSNLNL